MRLVLLHLSDLHIRSSGDYVLARARQISDSLNRYLPDAEALLFVVSGDVAFSGTREQYDLAEHFINEVKSFIRDEKDLPMYVIMVPGNHDCDFSNSGSVRSAILDFLSREGEAAIDDERIAACIDVQSAFNEFRRKFEPSTLLHNDPLWMQYQIDVRGAKVIFDCLNVSWCSKLHESQGRLMFPVKKYQQLPVPEHALRIVLLHHPLNWYNQATYHDFRVLVRKSGNFVISGHEHTQGLGEVDDAISGQSTYIEGAALQPSDAAEVAGFNVIEIDLKEQQYRCELYVWADSKYQPKELLQAWSSYRQLPQVRNNEFEMTKELLDLLNEPGANFKHPASEGNLKLSDFYIFPDLEEIVEDGKENRYVSGAIFQSLESIGNDVLIKGAEKSGKTALLLSLFRSHHESGYVPVLLRGDDIASASEKDLERLIEKTISQHYSKRNINSWNDLTKKRKVLLYDDLGRTRVAERFRWKIISFFKSRFSRIIATSDEMIDIDQATSSEAAEVFSQFDHYEIRPFGHKLRHDLIRKWNSIGEDYTRSSAELVAQIDKAEKIINSVLGKNLVPRVPLYLLTLLQSQESANTGDIQNSAFGYYYQYLLTQDLQRTTVRRNEYDEFFGYCSKLAWFYHQSKQRELNAQTLRGFSDAYSNKYHSVQFSARLNQLCEARWLTKRGDYYSFSYPYIYNFFLGKYLAEQLTDEVEVRNLVEHYCGHLYVREYANAILFLTHHSKDAFVIDCVVNKLRLLFSDAKPICLDEDTATLNELVESTSRLILPGGDPEANRRRHREIEDEVEASQNEGGREPEKEMDGELDLPSRLNMLFKTVEILGQILKNHYGRIENTVKLSLMREVYCGPLRALRGFLEAIEKDRDAIVVEIENFIGSKERNLDAEQCKKIARQSLFELIGMVTFAFLHKAASAVGSEHLRGIGQQLVKEAPSTSFRLIELATQLDGPATLPFPEIERLAKDTSSNIFAHRLLETIVLRHSYFFKVSETDKQRICNILGVSMKNQRQIDVRSKDHKLM